MSILEQQEHAPAAMANVRSELKAALSGSGVYRPKQGLISLSGKDRVRWLNGMISNNVRDLAAGNGVYAFVLNAQGQIQGDLYAFNLGETLVLEIERQQIEKLLPLLRRYIIMDKVEVEDLSEKLEVVRILGPQSPSALEAVGLNTSDLALLQIVEHSWRDHPVTIVRKDNPLVPDYELWVPKTLTTEIVSTLVENGSALITEPAAEAFRIISGIPKIGQDIRDRNLPQETGQDRALNFNKGCFIGQEIVERIRARGSVHRAFTGFEVTAASPTSGTKIQSAGKEAGEITSIATVPTGSQDKTIALGYLRKEYFGPETELFAGDARLTVASLPFVNILKS